MLLGGRDQRSGLEERGIRQSAPGLGKHRRKESLRSFLFGEGTLRPRERVKKEVKEGVLSFGVGRLHQDTSMVSVRAREVTMNHYDLWTKLFLALVQKCFLA